MNSRIQQRKTNQHGFTLTEIIFSAFLFAMLVILMGSIFQKGHGLFDILSAQSETQRNGRKIVQSLSSVIRQARVGAIQIPGSPGNTQIRIDLPLYQTSPGNCSAYALVADGTAPVSCNNNADCATACGGAGSMTCANNICRRDYTYSISSAAGIAQLVASAPGEANQVIGNRVQSITFQDNTMDANLQANEVRIALITSGSVISEKRTHTLALSDIVRMRN